MCMLFIKQIVSAQPVYEEATNITLSVPCTTRGEYCSGNATCSCSILDPDGEIVVNNQTMVRNEALFEVDLIENQTEKLGEYEFNVVCSDDGRSATKFLTFWITPNGELATTSKGIIYIGLLIALIIFGILAVIGGAKAEHIALKTFLMLSAYLFLLGIVFIGWNLSADFLTSAPFITAFFRIVWWFLLVALFPIILCLTIYTFWMIRKIDVIQKMIDKGIPEDEAYGRTVKGGFRSKNW